MGRQLGAASTIIVEDFQGALGGPAVRGVQEVPGGPLGLLHRPDLPDPECQDHLYRLLLPQDLQVPEVLPVPGTNRNHSTQASSPKLKAPGFLAYRGPPISQHWSGRAHASSSVPRTNESPGRRDWGQCGRGLVWVIALAVRCYASCVRAINNGTIVRFRYSDMFAVRTMTKGGE